MNVLPSWPVRLCRRIWVSRYQWIISHLFKTKTNPERRKIEWQIGQKILGEFLMEQALIKIAKVKTTSQTQRRPRMISLWRQWITQLLLKTKTNPVWREIDWKTKSEIRDRRLGIIGPNLKPPWATVVNAITENWGPKKKCSFFSGEK